MRETIAEIRIVFEEEFRRNIRRRAWQIAIVIVPLLLLVALVAIPAVRSITANDEEPKPIGYMDLSGEITEGLYPELTAFTSREAGVQAVVNGDIEDFFVVPADFLKSGEIEWLTNRSGIFAGEDNRVQFDRLLTVSVVADRLEPDVLERILLGSSYTRVRISDDRTVSEEDTEISQFVVPSILTVLMLMSIFLSSGTLLQSVSEEKENRMMEVLLTSLSPIALLGGKVLALGLSGLIQIAVWITAIALLGPRVIEQIPDAGDLQFDPSTFPAMVLFFIVGYFLFAVTFAGIGAATTSAREAGPITAIVTLPAVIPVYLSSVLLSDPDGGLARTLSFIPLTAPTTMIQRIGSGGVSTVEMLGSLVLTAAVAGAMLFVSARVFRAGLLMYGQRMTLPAVWRAVRQAT